jgi:hypothetical protein
MAIYYINTLDFSAATSVFLDIGMDTLAPDGFYSFNGDSYRQQIGGVLSNVLTCTPAIANDDTYSAIVTQGINGYNILSNDTIGTSGATTSNITITQLSTTNPSANINTSTGAVVVSTGTSVGTYYIAYQICEILDPTNCDSATVTVGVTPLVNNYCYTFDNSCELACDGTGTTICFYSICSTLVVGCKLYTNDLATTLVADGYYSNGTTCYQVVNGIITVISTCAITPVFSLGSGTTCTSACTSS